MKDIREEMTTTHDQIEQIGKSIIQHGKFNDRIYLMQLHADDFPHILDKLEDLARASDYAKIFAKVPSWTTPAFKGAGYILEALIPGFFTVMGEDACFMSKFMNSDRVHFLPRKELSELSRLLMDRKVLINVPPLDPEFNIRNLDTADIDELSQIYRQVFATYPFPIHEPDYLHEAMESNVRIAGLA